MNRYNFPPNNDRKAAGILGAKPDPAQATLFSAAKCLSGPNAGQSTSHCSSHGLHLHHDRMLPPTTLTQGVDASP